MTKWCEKVAEAGAKIPTNVRPQAEGHGLACGAENEMDEQQCCAAARNFLVKTDQVEEGNNQKIEFKVVPRWRR